MTATVEATSGRWSAALPVVSSPAARRFFLLTCLISIGAMLLAAYLPNVPHLSRIYVTLFVVLDYWAAVSVLLILICALMIPNGLPLRQWLRWIAAHTGGIAVCTAVILCAGSLLVYQNHPLAMDEYVQLLQSQVFAAGHLSGRLPPALLNWLVPQGFQNTFLIVSPTSGAVASVYWPSFALLLTALTFLGIPWACNPLISAATLLVIRRLTLRIFSAPEIAGLAVLLTLASPVFFADGISYYSMSAHLLANACYALLLTRPTPGRVFSAGVVGSVALTLHNPVPHLLFALPWLLWLATGPERLRLLASIVLGYAPICALLGLGWFWFTGDLRNAGPQSTASTHMIGQVFSAPDSSVLWARLIGIAKIWVWAVPGCLLLTFMGAWSCRANTFCRLLACSALLTLLGYLFVPFDQGHGWGFRYFHSAWLALPILSAAAVRDEQTRTLVVGCAFLTLLFGVGLRAWQIHGFIADDLAQMPAYSGTERRVVILDTTTDFYGADLVQNDPWLRGPVIRMISQGKAPDEAMMRAHFPDMHQVYGDVHGTVWSSK